MIGSFQKDGAGFKEGEIPKLIKGPDIFLSAIARLKEDIDELFVLLTGPARGYVKAGLTRLGVPYKHVRLNDYSEIGKCYHALDQYLITSREEGGPRAVLEAMASGIPLVTTRVGQAIDLVHHGINGWMVRVEDIEGLVHYSKHVLERPTGINNILRNARETSVSNCYDAQIPLWEDFMDGFVESY